MKKYPHTFFLLNPNLMTMILSERILFDNVYYYVLVRFKYNRKNNDNTMRNKLVIFIEAIIYW